MSRPPNMDKQEVVKNTLASLPLSSGVYRFLDADGKVIYVGKAKSLRKRVAQYFHAKQENNGKTGIMVRKIAAIEHTVTADEADALLLENNLIKELQPRYNILLKDNKTYPWICIKNEPFARVLSTRQRLKDGSRYYGPYTSGALMHVILDLVRQLYPLRTCKLSLTPQAITAGKYRVCLQYHLGRCKGPCTGQQSAEEYAEQLAAIEKILSGKSRYVAEAIRQKMQTAAQALRFEEAQACKKQLELLTHYQSQSVVVHPSISNADVFSLVQEGSESFVNFLRVVEGSIIQSYNFEMKLGIEESLQDQLLYAITETSRRLEGLAAELIVPFLPGEAPAGSHFHVPQRGDKLRLLEMSRKNAQAFRLEKEKRTELIDPERSVQRVMQTAQQDLRMQHLPLHIECFDNSNIQGSDPVAACVVFKKGKPSKKDYRKFMIKTVVGPDDFASMHEVLSRRYSRLLAEQQPLPQLVVIDGGKGQLGMAVGALEALGLREQISVVGLGKRLEEIFFPGDPDPLFLDKNSPTLRLLMQLRDEAHRFGLRFHRDKRSKGQIHSRLRDIPGVGAQREAQLLRKFKSLNGILAASPRELAKEVGPKLAERILEDAPLRSARQTGCLIKP
jgi:excinuclease ABC, C subunit